jgi:hypothetical protein
VIPQVLTKEFPAIAVVEALYKVAPAQTVQAVAELLKYPDPHVIPVVTAVLNNLLNVVAPVTAKHPMKAPDPSFSLAAAYPSLQVKPVKILVSKFVGQVAI